MTEEQAIDPTKCYIHPNREATLRCNQCDRPICIDCAIKVPTGYRCRECVRGQQKKFDTAEWYDFPLAILIAGGLSFLGSILLGVISARIGFFILFILIIGAPAVGKLIAEAVRKVIRKRRSRRLFQAVAVAVAVGGLLPHTFTLLALLTGNLGVLLSLLWPGVYIFLVTTTVYYLLSGIRLTR